MAAAGRASGPVGLRPELSIAEEAGISVEAALLVTEKAKTRRPTC